MAVPWKSSLRVSPVTAVKSDRCVVIQVCLTNCSLSIINVYLPTSDYPLDIFKEYLHELDTISALQSDGPVMVLGDFNAHLGSLGGQRGIGEANPQGKLLLDLICRTNLFVASLCSISSGPSYTFFRGAQHTTVDYCLLDNHAAHILQECVTLDHHPQITSHCLFVLILPHLYKTNHQGALKQIGREQSQMAQSRDISSRLAPTSPTCSHITTSVTFPLPKGPHSWTTRFELVLKPSYRLHNTPSHVSSPVGKKRNTSRIHHSTQSAVRARLRGTHGVVVADPGVALCTRKCVKGRKMSDPMYVAPEHERKDLGFKSVIVYFMSVTLVDFSFLAITHLAES